MDFCHIQKRKDDVIKIGVDGRVVDVRREFTDNEKKILGNYVLSNLFLDFLGSCLLVDLHHLLILSLSLLNDYLFERIDIILPEGVNIPCNTLNI